MGHPSLRVSHPPTYLEDETEYGKLLDLFRMCTPKAQHLLPVLSQEIFSSALMIKESSRESIRSETHLGRARDSLVGIGLQATVSRRQNRELSLAEFPL